MTMGDTFDEEIQAALDAVDIRLEKDEYGRWTSTIVTGGLGHVVNSDVSPPMPSVQMAAFAAITSLVAGLLQPAGEETPATEADKDRVAARGIKWMVMTSLGAHAEIARRTKKEERLRN